MFDEWFRFQGYPRIRVRLQWPNNHIICRQGFKRTGEDGRDMIKLNFTCDTSGERVVDVRSTPTTLRAERQ